MRNFAPINSLFTSLAWCALACLGGCHHGAPHPPEGWLARPAEFNTILPTDGEGQLLIVIGYGPTIPNHTAVFLWAPQRAPLFWDPGGGWGEGPEEELPPGVTKVRDLVTRGVPDMQSYLDYRWRACFDSAVEILVWKLPARRAQQLHRILTHGTDAAHRAGRFTSQSAGMFCAVSTSDFLRRFGPPEIPLRYSYCLPQSLARELYTHRPHRLLIKRRGGAWQAIEPR